MKRAALIFGAVALLGIIAAKGIRSPEPPPRLSLEPAHLRANGYSTAILRVESQSIPHAALDNPHAATISAFSRIDGAWQAQLRAGVMPGSYVIYAGPAHATLTLDPDPTDTARDGTPDFLRLDDPRDQDAFRRWFTFLAEAQYFQAPEARPVEIVDCAALIRYAYREALRAHDSAWATAAHLPITPAFDSVTKYRYPYTALGANLFRVPEGFAEFADAKTLQRLNTHFISRNLARALPGDLLFFRQDVEHMPYHSMIYIGPSQLVSGPARYIVYHTGEDAIKRLTADELLHYPETDWRPVEGNPFFLGVYRWNILRKLP